MPTFLPINPIISFWTLGNIFVDTIFVTLTKSKVDPSLYLKVMDDEPVILLLYVDDLFLTGNEKQITKSKKKPVE